MPARRAATLYQTEEQLSGLFAIVVVGCGLRDTMQGQKLLSGEKEMPGDAFLAFLANTCVSVTVCHKVIPFCFQRTSKFCQQKLVKRSVCIKKYGICLFHTGKCWRRYCHPAPAGVGKSQFLLLLCIFSGGKCRIDRFQ